MGNIPSVGIAIILALFGALVLRRLSQGKKALRLFTSQPVTTEVLRALAERLQELQVEQEALHQALLNSRDPDPELDGSLDRVDREIEKARRKFWEAVELAQDFQLVPETELPSSPEDLLPDPE